MKVIVKVKDQRLYDIKVVLLHDQNFCTRYKTVIKFRLKVKALGVQGHYEFSRTSSRAGKVWYTTTFCFYLMHIVQVIDHPTLLSFERSALIVTCINHGGHHHHSRHHFHHLYFIYNFSHILHWPPYRHAFFNPLTVRVKDIMMMKRSY